MQARALTIYNPFDPLGSRREVVVQRRRSIRALAPRSDRPFVAILNGRAVLRACWRYRLRDGDGLVFLVLPRGGAGGSNPLRLILGLALMAFAPWAVAGFGGAFVTSTGALSMLGQATSLGIIMVGSAAINALLPVPKPFQMPTPSPTYSLQAQGNTARLEQPIPVQYGRMLAFPDFAAQPYAEFHGGEQYLYQLLCLGAGEFDVEEIRIEDTPISSFAEIETEIVPPGGHVTLFPTSVIISPEVSGQDLPGHTTGTYVWATTVITISETAHGRAAGQALYLDFTSGGATSDAYLIATVVDADHFTVTHATGAGSGAVNVHTIVGGIDGFVASAADSANAHHLAFDLVLPRGLFGVAGSALATKTLSVTLQARNVDANGLPIGTWLTLATKTFTNRTTTPIRQSLRYALATPGRYRVRAWRVDAKDESATVGHDAVWSSLRAYIAASQNFGPVTLIAMRMRATNNLSLQASRMIGVVCTRKVPVWNGATWSAPVATASLAWAIADAARNADYGAGLTDAQIDLAALLALDTSWAGRGDNFNGRFDQAATWWEAASRIALAGRARLFMQGGVLRVVRDAAATLPVALFSMRNIKRGSFALDYLSPTEASATRFEISYFDSVTWSPRRVTATLPGSAGLVPVKMELFGVTNRAQALREGLYHAAANRYRRRIVKFTTEMEGFIPSIGDLIAVQHDMPGWGAQAEAVAWDAATRTLTVSEPMTFGAGSHSIGIRTAAGGMSGPWLVTAGATDHDLVLSQTPDMTPYTGAERERSHVVFVAAATWQALARVAAVRPRGLTEVEIECVIEDPSVHTADQGVTAPPIVLSDLPRRVVAPVIGKLVARLMPDDATRAVFSWRPAAGAEIYQFEMAEGQDVTDPDVTWTRIGDTTSANFTATLLHANQTMVRVRGIGMAAGPWQAATIGSLIHLFWTADPVLVWNADPATLFWSA